MFRPIKLEPKFANIAHINFENNKEKLIKGRICIMPHPIAERPTELSNAGLTKLGADYDPQSNEVSFSVFSKNASLIQISFYKEPANADEVLAKHLARQGDIWNIRFSRDELRGVGVATDYVYYGYRAWGPNWSFHDHWQKGGSVGFVSDVDSDGNRFNPNKLLIDPYAVELSHDPEVTRLYMDPPGYIDAYYGGDFRNADTGKMAPKSVLLMRKDRTDYGVKPQRALNDDVIYEVNLRGFTMRDERIPSNERGTFKGAAKKAKYLKELGVTAVEFLPVQEFADAQNDDGDSRGDNYWGYMTINYFAPNRRYASDQSPGGPTREFKEMVKAFHDEGIKVLLDVVYNHTGEGILRRNLNNQGNPTSQREIENTIRAANASRGNDDLQDFNAAGYLSYAGLDNQSYYLLRDGNRRYEGRGGCGGNLNYDNQAVKNLIYDSLQYWANEMGVDGFRFDLAPILSLTGPDGANWPNANTTIFSEISRVLPARAGAADGAGVDLIAEPWGDNSVINWAEKFPSDWAVWNREFRDRCKTAMNKYGVEAVPVWKIANAIAGSAILKKKPWNAVNYFVSHDDCNSLRNLFSYNKFWHLDEAGERCDQISWDQGGQIEAQKKAVRNAFTLLMLAAGVPMFAGGDELFRAIPPYGPGLGKMNLVGVDRPEVYLDFQKYHEMTGYLDSGDPVAANRLIETDDQLYTFVFVRNLINFRNRHESLRPDRYFTGNVLPNGLKDLIWYQENGTELTADAWDRTGFIAWRINAHSEKTLSNADRVDSIYCAYNLSPAGMEVRFPPNLSGKRWYRVLDTDNTGGWMTRRHNFDGGATLLGPNYQLHERSILVLVEK
jgi:isoamylase